MASRVDRLGPETRMNTGSDGPLDAPAREIVSVGQLNRAVAGLLERSFPLLWVAGEISNLTRAASGHWYFSLKDATASVRAVMFRGRNQHVAFAPANGDRVEVRAQVGLYEARGDFQLNVEQMRPAGAGDLFQQFLRLKARLEAEGLFDEARKRPLPASPRCVGVVTSPKAAALRDVLTTLARRAPQVPVILYPAAVQGAQAPGELIRALGAAGARAECDVLLLVRGGGAIEDLWAFNDEALARAIAACPIPVVSGVGHETDFTIADFVADLRAPTPTGAATRAVPDRAERLATLARDRHRLVQAWRRLAEQREQRLDTATRLLRPPSLLHAQRTAALGRIAQRLAIAGERAGADRARRLAALAAGLRAPDLALRRSRLDGAGRAFGTALRARLEAAAARLARGAEALEMVSPQAVLARGYAIVTGPDGAIARRAATLSPGDAIAVRLADGGFDARVTALARIEPVLGVGTPASGAGKQAPDAGKSARDTGPD
jgi:exodeoxyribonuclease VII large subunit